MANRQSSGAIDDSEYPKIKVSDGVELVHTGTTDPTVLKTYTVPAGYLGANGVLKYTVMGYTYGNNDDKTLNATFNGDAANEAINQASVDDKGFKVSGRIMNQNAEDAQIVMFDNIDDISGASCNYFDTLTVDTSGAIVLNIVGTLANAGDEIRIEYFEVEILPAD